MTCRHDLPDGTCATCKGISRDKLAEVIDDQTTTCRSPRCGAEIVWAITVNGRRMPVDVEPSADGGVELYLDGGDLHARVLKRQELQQATLGVLVELRQSHFVTCIDTEAFRNRPGA